MTLRSYVCVSLLLCLPFIGKAQSPFYHYFQDTLYPGYRISGSFDSTDVRMGAYQTTLPGAWRIAWQAFDLSLIDELSPTIVLPRRFSAIPHVGLQYSFGSNVSQRSGISYTQALSPRQFIQVDYVRNNTNGVLRNSTYENNRFQLEHLYRGKRYASEISMYFNGMNKGLNGGLSGDTLSTDFGLQFSDVEKNDAQLIRRHFKADWAHYLSFTQDSLLKTGLFAAPCFRIENRLYTETGDIAAIYGTANIDPDRTRDFWEQSEIGGKAGYFFHHRAFALNAGIFTKYRDFDNLTHKSDTLEAGISGNLILRPGGGFSLSASAALTFAGAAGEKELRIRMAYRYRKLTAAFNAGIEQRYPFVYQRAYFANALDYSWTTRQLRTETSAKLQIRSGYQWVPLTFTASVSNVQNNPFFLVNEWRQDTLTNLTFLRAELKGSIRYSHFFFYPEVRLQQRTLDYFPSLQAMARTGFDGLLFKAKKLRAAIGVEAGYTSSFSLLDYVPMMDTYILPSGGTTTAKYQAMARLHVFTELELGFFRWFIRVENIEQAFLSSVNSEAMGYPVVPLQLRMGLSWDLFN